MSEPAPVILISGTDTDVGKTVATAAISAALVSKGQRVHVVKPTQTGVIDTQPGDATEVSRLAGAVTVSEFVRLPEPLAPDVAARRAGVTLPTVADHAARIADIARDGSCDVVLVEGAGGLLVHLDADCGTLADLAIALSGNGIRAGFVIVVREGLGTLNHTELTLEALRHRELDLIGLVIGSAQPDPDLASRTNHAELAALGALLGVIPAGAARLSQEEFQRRAPGWVRL